MKIGSIPIRPEAQLRAIVVSDLRVAGLNGTSGLSRVAEKIVSDLLQHHEVARYREALEEIEEYHSGRKGVHPDIAFDSITEILAETLH